MSKHPFGPNRFLGKGILVGAVGLALAAAGAGPAMADPIPDPPPPALTQFAAVTSTSAPAPVKEAPAAASTSRLAPAATTGERQTFTRGGSLAWSSDTFQWFWSGSKLTSSTASQADGYVFPNTVSLKGVVRTYATSAEHLWRGTSVIGAGVVTPWGSVNVYNETFVDYFTLTPGKLTHSDS